MPTPTESPDPREGGCSPSLGPVGNVGGHRGEKLFPPSAFLLLPRSLIPSCPYPYRQRQTMQWPSFPLQHALSHMGPPQGGARLGHKVYTVAARSEPQF